MDGYVIVYGAIRSATTSAVSKVDGAAIATADVDELLMLMVTGSLRPEWQASVLWCLNETNRLRVPCIS